MVRPRVLNIPAGSVGINQPYQHSLEVFDVVSAIELKYVNYYFVDFLLKPDCIII